MLLSWNSSVFFCWRGGQELIEVQVSVYFRFQFFVFFHRRWGGSRRRWSAVQRVREWEERCGGQWASKWAKQFNTELDWSELCQSGVHGREILEIFRVGRNRGICLQPSFSRHVYGKQTREQDYRLNAHKENWFYSRGPDYHRRQQRSEEESWHQSVLKVLLQRREKKGTTSRPRGTLKGSWFRVQWKYMQMLKSKVQRYTYIYALWSWSLCDTTGP